MGTTCDGREIYADDYKDYFKLVNYGKNDNEKLSKVKLPNLIGRMIIGAGEIRTSGGAGKAQLKNSSSAYNINQTRQ